MPSIRDNDLLEMTSGERRTLRRQRVMSGRQMRHALKRAQRRLKAELRDLA